MDIRCPQCSESEDLSGERDDELIHLTCGACGATWERDLSPACSRCGGDDLQAVPLAIVEKGRGTQLSVVGTRIIHLCYVCDATMIEQWQRNRPNPLMPDELPNAGGETTG